jgi:glycosyltransferase involved in cell wall biosynthesis
VKISIIVPAFNEERLLPASLASIQAATLGFTDARWETELIVCNNNSTDRTPEIAAAAGAHVVFAPINQISRARNAGAAEATGDWLLFIDADSFPTRALFADVVLAIESGRYVAGGSTLRFDTDDRVARFVIEWWNLSSRVLRWAAGSFIFCDAAAFRAIGGFTAALYAAEEIDLFRRLKRHGRRNGRTVVILSRHPLVTSGRKGDLYTRREMARFWWQTILSRGATLKSSRRAFPWYDGRR